MIINTQKLAATDTDGERIRVKKGALVLDVPFDYGSADPYADAAQRLVPGKNVYEVPSWSEAVRSFQVDG